MDTVTYPDREVESRLKEFSCARFELAPDQPQARRFNVVWTPALMFLDGQETVHYRTYGYYPPEEFRQLLGMARGTAEFHRGNYKDAVASFSRVAEEGAQTSFQPEALYWLGVSHYRNGDRDNLMKAWNSLLDRHPADIWAKKVGFLRG